MKEFAAMIERIYKLSSVLDTGPPGFGVTCGGPGSFNSDLDVGA
jgi:hypothetical protein